MPVAQENRDALYLLVPPNSSISCMDPASVKDLKQQDGGQVMDSEQPPVSLWHPAVAVSCKLFSAGLSTVGRAGKCLALIHHQPFLHC